jgi:peptidoglycan/xylan/chitin deacetylase (PgdA/CDA1 family)
MRIAGWVIAVIGPVAVAGGATCQIHEALAAAAPCTVVGTTGDDRLVGTAAADVICGGAGDDVIVGAGGDDVLLGNGGNDVIRGSGDADLIRGGGGDDVLSGGQGRDEVRGQGGNDRVAGGIGRDRLFGGARHDVIRARDGVPYDRVDGGTGQNLCVVDPSDTRRRCSHPLVGPLRPVPILMYHVIAEASAATPLAYLWVSPREFAAQMRWLDRHRYHVVTLREAYDWWHGAPLPSRPIVVSFDDGFRNQFSRAMPVLDRHGWAGTLNLALSHYAQQGWGLGRRAITAMIQQGWEIDSHTMTHATLPGLSMTQLAHQVGHSRSVLRRLFHVPVDFFCYPSGAYDARVIAAVRRAGYQAATSTEPGLARWNDLWALDRVRVNRGDGASGLAAHLRALGLPG